MAQISAFQARPFLLRGNARAREEEKASRQGREEAKGSAFQDTQLFGIEMQT